MPLRQGRVQVYTGDGKGKTSAALGLAWRALGRGLSVLMIQFMKAPDSTGEEDLARRLGPKMDFRARGLAGFITAPGGRPEDRALAVAALAEAREELTSGRYDLVILDEINMAVDFALLTPAEVLNLMAVRPPQVELVLTGRHALPDILAQADLVSEIRAVKHYYDQGQQAREGIEY